MTYSHIHPSTLRCLPHSLLLRRGWIHHPLSSSQTHHHHTETTSLLALGARQLVGHNVQHPDLRRSRSKVQRGRRVHSCHPRPERWRIPQTRSIRSSFERRGERQGRFHPILSKLFANDPQRSGYALYRLDSQSASGEWEWLCCSYQPDGAKIKEKMQYAITRSSLMAGLTERNFMDTIFGATPKDFLWPSKLRNSRKHDYQNPQLKTAGKPASEAAGTGVGGARRNFGSVSKTNNLRGGDESPPHESSSNLNATSGVSGVTSSHDPEPQRPQPVPESEQPVITSPPQPKRYNSHEFTSAFKSPTPPAAEEPQAEKSSSATSDNAKQFAAETKAPEEPTTPAVAAGSANNLSQPTVPSDSTLSAAAGVASATVAGESESKLTTAEQELAETKAPQEPPTPSTQSSAPLSQPTLPTSLDQATLKESTPEKPQEKSSISIGSGTGASRTGLTQREEDLAELRRLQATERASGGSNGGSGFSGGAAGGPTVGFKWGDGVQEAIQGFPRPHRARQSGTWSSSQLISGVKRSSWNRRRDLCLLQTCLRRSVPMTRASLFTGWTM